MSKDSLAKSGPICCGVLEKMLIAWMKFDDGSNGI